MKIVLKVLALGLLCASSSVAWAEEQGVAANADVTAKNVAAPISLFPDSSVTVWTYYYGDVAGKKDSFKVAPHFSTPVLNKFLNMDAYVDIAQEEDSVHLKKPAVTIDFEKELVSNDYFIVAPYLEFVNPFQSRNSQILAMFVGQASLPISTSLGIIAPYVLTESGMGVNTSKTDLSATYQEGPKGLALTGKQLTDRGLAASVVGKAQKYPISTYTRGGIGYTPAGVEGLKVNFVVNVIASPSDTYTLDAKTKSVLKVTSKWATTTQPMIQVNYKVNDKIALRNETTRNYDGFFENVKESQKVAGAISNVTRLIYTIF